MTFLELFDETLDINSTENYEMSIEAGADGFSFCLLDTLRNKYVLLRSFRPEDNKIFSAADVSELIGKDDFLSRIYRGTRILMPSQSFTLIPSGLYDNERQMEYFALNHRLTEGQKVLQNKLADPDAFLLFSVQEKIHDALTGYFPSAAIYSHVYVLLEHISRARKSVTGNYVHVHVESEYFNLVIFNGDQLIFCNSFRYHNVPDIMYYILNVFSQTGIKQEEIIHLSGIKRKNDELTANLRDYAQDVRFSVPRGNFTFSYVFGDIEIHRYLNLFNAVNCE